MSSPRPQAFRAPGRIEGCPRIRARGGDIGTRITAVTCHVSRSKFYVQVESDAGVSGFGESSPMRPDVLLQIHRSVIRPAVLGMDPFQAEAIEERVLRRNYKIAGQLLAAAFSGLEIALWDLRGRYLGQPVYNLLGGRYRGRVPVYGSSMSRDLPPAEEAAKLRGAIARLGITAVKIKVGPRYGSGAPVDLDADEEKVRTVREAIGPSCRLMLDGNGSYTYIEAVQLYHRVERYRIHHFEEPCPYRDVEAYVRLAHSLPVPIHVGEQDWDLFTFRDFISRGACHLYAADPVKCGGLSSAKRAATLCRAFGIQYVPHNTTRSIGFAAALHLAASTPECAGYAEYSIEREDAPPPVALPFEVRDGCVGVPDGPGLGFHPPEPEALAATLQAHRD